MIEIKGLEKSFGDFKALNDVSFQISDNKVFGIIGTNGAGKSTLLRCMAGILKPEKGEILIDNEPVYENPEKKSRIFYISDEQFFFPGYTPLEEAKFYQNIYPGFSMEKFLSLLESFRLDKNRRVADFSKGMKKQISVFLGLSSNTNYLLMDESFDGLDPVVRLAVKKLFIAGVENEKLTPVIASHNLRELEDICDTVGLLHKGGIIFSKDIEKMKTELFKLQIVIENEDTLKNLTRDLEILNIKYQGKIALLTLRDRDSLLEKRLKETDSPFYELLPLSLEEIFISETEVLGYDFSNLIL